MIEREFIKNKIKNLNIKSKIQEMLKKTAGCGGIRIEKTPLGEKITIYTLRPGLVIGRGGETIKVLTNLLKSYYQLENPQIEVVEINQPFLNASTVAKRIADDLEKFGPTRFKAIGYRALSNIMKAGAMGAEIRINGKLPGSRAKSWRFYSGYLKKSGEVSEEGIDRATEIAKLKAGVVGVTVKIMPPSINLPDKITIKFPEIKVEEIKETAESQEKGEKTKEPEPKEEKKETKKKVKEKSPSKKTKKKEDKR